LLVRITNQALDYPWGSKTLIPDYFGIAETEKPMAEIWYGTHPVSPSMVEGIPEITLRALIEKELPFLVKILAAAEPLSIQVHPDSFKARAGFDRENAAGIDIVSPQRNYRDSRNKPELLIALTDGFQALCGFRPLPERSNILLQLSRLDARLLKFATWAELATSEKGLRVILSEMLESTEVNTFVMALKELKLSELGEEAIEAVKLALELCEKYPGDNGVLVSILLNQVVLSEGEAIYLPEGNLHAYIQGLGIEVMAASDNVIRGGLTSKHIDVAELLKITEFTELTNPVVSPKPLAQGLRNYPVPTDEFLVYRAQVSPSNLLIDLDLPGDAILLCTQGEVAVSSSLDEREVIKRSQAVYLSGAAKKFSLTGSGTVFMATQSKVVTG
jgi:mannose-6-phosphate isomerase